MASDETASLPEIERDLKRRRTRREAFSRRIDGLLPRSRPRRTHRAVPSRGGSRSAACRAEAVGLASGRDGDPNFRHLPERHGLDKAPFGETAALGLSCPLIAGRGAPLRAIPRASDSPFPEAKGDATQVRTRQNRPCPDLLWRLEKPCKGPIQSHKWTSIGFRNGSRSQMKP